eukprot:TRINITY_DN11214_c0_g1_i1.p1 TRINITY_DN11214_c0_g1~~TRINITY_DN11214_c0_g1_i1.p1  ORF type:complete len:749 (+),score=183.44 TRINITY_DN11214_c0_g1_i1:40-2247(+)
MAGLRLFVDDSLRSPADDAASVSSAGYHAGLLAHVSANVSAGRRRVPSAVATPIVRADPPTPTGSPGAEPEPDHPYAPRRNCSSPSVNPPSLWRYAVCERPRRSSGDSSDDSDHLDASQSAAAARAGWASEHLGAARLPAVCLATKKVGVEHRAPDEHAEDDLTMDSLLLTRRAQKSEMLRVRVACPAAGVPAAIVEIQSQATVGALSARAVLHLASEGSELKGRLAAGSAIELDGRRLLPTQRLADCGIDHNSKLLLIPAATVQKTPQMPSAPAQSAVDMVHRFCEMAETSKDEGRPLSDVQSVRMSLDLAIGGAAARLASSFAAATDHDTNVLHPATIWIAEYLCNNRKASSLQPRSLLREYRGRENAMVQMLLAKYGPGVGMTQYESFVTTQRARARAEHSPGPPIEAFVDDQTGQYVGMDAATKYSVLKDMRPVYPLSDHPGRQWFIDYFRSRAPARVREVDKLLWDWLYNEEGLRDVLLDSHGPQPGLQTWESYITQGSPRRVHSGDPDTAVVVLKQRGPWQKIQEQSGAVYYFNETTGASRWDPDGTPFAAGPGAAVQRPVEDAAAPSPSKFTEIDLSEPQQSSESTSVLPPQTPVSFVSTNSDGAAAVTASSGSVDQEWVLPPTYSVDVPLLTQSRRQVDKLGIDLARRSDGPLYVAGVADGGAGKAAGIVTPSVVLGVNGERAAYDKTGFEAALKAARDAGKESLHLSLQPATPLQRSPAASDRALA